MKLPYITEHKNTSVVQMEDPFQLNCVLWHDSTIKDIADKHREKGLVFEEYQMHYHAIQVTCDDVLHFTIPTVFYNIKQVVTPASIDYAYTDIVTEGAKALNKHLKITKEVLPHIYAILSSLYEDVQVTNISDNSIHKHPSPSGFSGTDLDTDDNDRGIIFRKMAGDNILQTDSILSLDPTQLCTNETRHIKDNIFTHIPTIAGTIVTYESCKLYELFQVEAEIIVKHDEYFELPNTLIDSVTMLFKALASVVPVPDLELLDINKISKATL